MTTRRSFRCTSVAKVAATAMLTTALPAITLAQDLPGTASGEAAVTIAPQPFYSVTAQLPSLQATAPETGQPNTSYELDFLASPDGEIANLNAFLLQDGQRRALCDPIPITVGNPPRTIWLIPDGCGDGGGGAGVLSVDTLVVEFATDDVIDLNDGTGTGLSLSVQEITRGVTSMPQRLDVPLPSFVAPGTVEQ